MFEEEEEPEALESLINEDDDLDDLEDYDDDLDDPDPIPEVFTADEQEPDDEKSARRPWGKIIGIAASVLIVAVLATGYFARAFVVAMVPQLEQAVYKPLGIPVHSLGYGLQIQKVQFAQETEAGLEVLVVRGQIENVEKAPRPVPVIRATLLDEAGQELQSTDTAPLKSELSGGETISFKVRIKEPSPLRRRVTVTFTEQTDAGDGNGKEKG